MMANNEALTKKVGALFSNPSKRDIPGDLAPLFYQGKMSLEDLTSAISGTPTYDPSKGPQINFGSGNVAYQGTLDPKAYGAAGAPVAQVPDGGTSAGIRTPSAPGFTTGNATPVNVTAAGTQIAGGAVTPFTPEQQQQNQDIQTRYQQGMAKTAGKPLPQTGPEASQAAKNLVGPTPTTPVLPNVIQSDPGLADIQKAHQEYMNSVNQRTSLTQEYQNLLAASGLAGIDTQLINLKSVMEGTEDDIRNEITKAGGFATDSQVIALTNVRNKQNIKNYQNLLETRNALEKRLDTTMNLTMKDRENALREFDSNMNYQFKIAEYGQKMQEDARKSYAESAKQMGGWDKVLQSIVASGDLSGIDRINRSMGGGFSLREAAGTAETQRLQTEADAALDLKIKKLTYQQKLKEYNKLPESELDKLLTIDEAKAEGVPYGTTRRDLVGKVPGQQQLDSSVQPLRDKITMIDDLLNSSGMAGTVGAYGLARWTPFTADKAERQNFIAGVHQLVNKETIDTLVNLKARGGTLGALSDQERMLLQNAATKIADWEIKKDGIGTGRWEISEDFFKQELKTIQTLARKAVVKSLGYDPTLIKDDDMQQINEIYGGGSTGATFNPASFYQSTPALAK